MKLKEHLDKIGFLGTLVVAFCCLGVPVWFALLGALGATFLASFRILFPLLVLSLILVVLGLAISYKKHKKPQCLILGAVSGIIFFLGFWYGKNILFYLGLIGLLTSSVWNIYLKKKCCSV